MKITFSSFPDLSDNVIAILMEYLKHKNNSIKLYYLYNNKFDLKNIYNKSKLYFGNNYSSKLHFVEKKSYLGVYHYLTSEISFETHGMFEKMGKLPWNTKVNLWHGMPLKKIGYMENNKKVKLNMDFTISTSPLFTPIISKVFNIDVSKIINIGEPKNDLLFNNINFSFKKIFKNDFPTIVWLPTYRQLNDDKISSFNNMSEVKIGGVSLNSLYTLQSILNKYKYNLAIKLHPIDKLNKLKLKLKFPNISIINENTFKSYNIAVNTFLKSSAALITDYSSVYFDYILLKKPIAILALDEKNYEKDRGFTSKKIKDNMVGYKISNLIDFEAFLKLVCKDEPCFNIQNKIKMFDKYDTHGNNSFNLLKKLKQI